MGYEKDIDELRRRLFPKSVEGAFYATVRSVNEESRTCTVEAEEIEYEDVLLYAIEDAELKGWHVVPAVDSQVLVERIGGSNELYVAMFSVVDKTVLTIGGKLVATASGKGLDFAADKTTLKALTGGFTLVRDGAGLKKTLTALCDAILALTVSTAVGPSSIPINAADFTNIKTELDKYLEE